MQLLKKISSLTDIRLGEEKIVAILFLHSLLLGFSTSFYFVAVNSFFLKQVSANDIPLAYIIAGLIGTFLMTIYRFIQKRAGVSSSFIATLILFSVVCITLFFFHNTAGAHQNWSIYIAYAGFILVFPFSVLFVVGFSGYCLQIFNLSQSKRLSALIGTGEVISSIIGYLCIPLFIKLFHGSTFLFLLAAAFILLSIIPLSIIYKKFHHNFIKHQVGKTATAVNWSFFKNSPFYITIGIATFFSVAAVYITDYSYLIAVRTFAQLSSIEVSIIISFVFSVIKIGELLFSLLSGNIISARGMKFSMIILPALLLLSVALAIVSYLTIDDVAFFLIAFFLLNKWSERVIRKGITIPAMKVLFQLAEPSKRAQIQAAVEGTISQFSVVITGILLFVITRWQVGHTSLQFLYIISIISAIVFSCWLLTVSNLYRKYKIKIQEYLHTIKPIVNTQNEVLEAWTNNAGKNGTAVLQAPVLEMVAQLESPSKQQLLEWIALYNSSIAAAIDNQAISINRKVITAYFTNDHFFSRQLIIKYLHHLPVEQRQRVIKEMYEVSDIRLRLQLLHALHKDNFAASAENRFYFIDLCSQCVREIIWVDATLEDFIGLNEPNLKSELVNYQYVQKEILLELLMLLYDAKAVQVIKEILKAESINKENELFAVELLDNILTEELKPIIIPVYEPITQHAKRQKLEKHFAIYNLPVEERLTEILMKDFKLINSYTKQLSLRIIHQLNPNNQTIVKAFTSSTIEHLQSTANEILSKSQVNVFLQKEKAASDLHLTHYFSKTDLYYFLRFGFFNKEGKLLQNTSTRGQHFVVLNDAQNKKFEADTLAVALLLHEV